MSSYLWQNFLTDSSVLTRIANEVRKLFEDWWCDTLIEIGPGKWALTKRILWLTSRTMVIEYDQKMIDYLNSHLFTQITDVPQIVHQDILKWDENNIQHFPYGGSDRQKLTTLIVGNLPYYITSPILRKFLWYTQKVWSGWVFLIQKEVAEKIVYNAPKKSFLRRLINYAYRVEYCFSVSPKAFTPPPKVTSAVIRAVPRSQNDIPSLSYDDLLIFLDQYSPFKRKTLWASAKIVQKLKIKNGELKIKDFDISPYAHQRLEELGWAEMEVIITWSHENY